MARPVVPPGRKQMARPVVPPGRKPTARPVVPPGRKPIGASRGSTGPETDGASRGSAVPERWRWRVRPFFRVAPPAGPAARPVVAPQHEMDPGYLPRAGQAVQRGHLVGTGRADRREPGPPGSRRYVRPWFRLPGQPEPCVARLDQRVRPRGPGTGRDRPRDHRQGRLDQAGDARRRPGVTEAGRGSAERRGGPRASPQPGERGQFGQVGVGGADAQALDQRDVGGIDAGPPVGLKGLRPRGPARDLRVHGQARRAGVGRARQHHDAAAIAGQQAGRVGRVDAHLAGAQQPGSRLQREPNRVEPELGPARDRQVQVPGRHGLGGRHQCVQRRQRRGLRIRHVGGEAELAGDQTG